MSGSIAPYPGAPEHGMLFVEAFGRLERVPGRPGAITAEEDLYSVFNARAELLGWSTTPRQSSTAGAEPRPQPVLWWMHEAELDAGEGRPRIGWVQVGLEVGVQPARALAALMQCFDDALRRFGAVDVSSLQVTASRLQPVMPLPAGDLVSALNWFNTGPQETVEALIAFDDGLLPPGSEAEFLAGLQHMNTGSFAFGPLVPVSPEHSIAVPREAPFAGALAPAGAGLAARLPEWTAGSVAWALAFAIDLARGGGNGARSFAVRLTRVR